MGNNSQYCLFVTIHVRMIHIRLISMNILRVLLPAVSHKGECINEISYEELKNPCQNKSYQRPRSGALLRLNISANCHECFFLLASLLPKQ